METTTTASPLPDAGLDNCSQLPVSRTPLLADAEVGRRLVLLSQLQAALDPLGIRCLLARNHRLVLRYNDAPCQPSGMTDPRLHIFTSAGTLVAATNGTTYRLDDGAEFPVSDPADVAALLAISSSQTTT